MLNAEVTVERKSCHRVYNLVETDTDHIIALINSQLQNEISALKETKTTVGESIRINLGTELACHNY